MGAGASVSEGETTRVTNLIAVISGDKNDGRLSALNELSKLCDQDDYKMPLIERGQLLPVLVKILSETGDISDDQIEAAKCCWYLARTYELKVPIARENNLISTLVSVMHRSQGDARDAALSVVINCAMHRDAVDYLLDSAFGLLDATTMIITTDTNQVNILSAYQLLANISNGSWMPDRIGEFLRLNLHVLALNVLKPLGPNTRTWSAQCGIANICIHFLTFISTYPEVAVSLKSAGALEIFTPLLASSDREAIGAALMVTFLSGKDESSAQKGALLLSYPHLTGMLVDLFEAQLLGGKGAAFDRMEQLGYHFGWYPINMVVRCVLTLSISDANKGALVATRILSLLVQLLKRFHDNAPPVGKQETIGNSTVTAFSSGGGDDIAAATAAIETIVQLTFFFDSNTELIQQFITPQSGVEKLFGDLLELSADRQLDREAKGQVCIKTSFVPCLICSFLTHTLWP